MDGTFFGPWRGHALIQNKVAAIHGHPYSAVHCTDFAIGNTPTPTVKTPTVLDIAFGPELTIQRMKG